MFLAGALLLQLWYLLDHVDGQIARYRKTDGLTGRYFDFLMHHLIHGILFAGLSGYLYRHTHQVVFLIWGFITSLAMVMFNLAQDAKYKTFFEFISCADHIQFTHRPKNPSGVRKFQRPSFISRKIFSFLHKSVEIHVAMNLLTLAAILQIVPVFRTVDFRFALFFYFALVIPPLAVIKISYLIARRQIDAEFEASFQKTGLPL